MNEVRLEFRNVTKRFRNPNNANLESITAVEGVSLKVKDGEVVSLIGPSGCGKSTLLNLASGLDQPSEGEVFVDANRVAGPNAHVAFMLQKDLLLPWRSISENVELGLEIQGVSKSFCRSLKVFKLFLIRFIVNPVNKFWFFFKLFNSFCNSFICKKHKLFN